MNRILLKFFISTIVFITLCCCSENSNKQSIDTELKVEDNTLNSYHFEITKTGNYNTTLDKFHHIHILGSPKVNLSNIDIVKKDALSNIIIRGMIDSLEKSIEKINLPDSLVNRIYVDMIDYNIPYCQIHKSFCIFRDYRFFANSGDTRITNEVVKIKNVRVQGLPIELYPVDSLLITLGEPDSIFVTDPNDVEVEEYIKYYYKNKIYSSTKNYPFCQLEKIEVTPETVIELDDIVLNHNTKIEDLKNTFPLSYLNVEKNIRREFDGFMRLLVKTDKGQIIDGALILGFKKGQLVEFEYWINNT